MLVYYQFRLIETKLFPEDTHDFRFNSINRKDCVSFVNHQDAITSLRSTGTITATPPANTRLVDNFKVACSPAKSLLKEMRIFSLLSKKEKNGMLGTGTLSLLLEHRTQQKC